MKHQCRDVRLNRWSSLYSVLIFLLVAATQRSVAQPSSPGLDRSRDFIQEQRQRSDQMMRDARARSDQMMRDARARNDQMMRDMRSGRTSSSSSTNQANRRSPRVRGRAIRGILALVVLVFGGLWKLISGNNRSSEPMPMAAQQGYSGSAPPDVWENSPKSTASPSSASSASTSPPSTSPPDAMKSSPKPPIRRDDFQYDTTSPLSGLKDKIRKR